MDRQDVVKSLIQRAFINIIRFNNCIDMTGKTHIITSRFIVPAFGSTSERKILISETSGRLFLERWSLLRPLGHMPHTSHVKPMDLSGLIFLAN